MNITIITVCFNASDSIEHTMLSVLHQTYKNIEYIVVDGDSQDNTLEKIQVIKKDYLDRDIKVVSEKDKGIYDAMNKGIRMASGSWILFLNSGDSFYNENVISEIFESYVDNGESIIYGKTVFYDAQNKKIENVRYSDYEFMPACHQSIFTRASELKNNPFDLDFKITADFVFYYKLYKRNPKYLKSDRIISIYDTNGISRTQYINVTKEHLKLYVHHLDQRSLKMFLRVAKYYLSRIWRQ